ncbi:MAG: hypothetical protein FWE17_00115 [Alphaproteobacteria bacterium]|nr:hypothetical protein [Alphaproteobacteria bacterium]MCL2757894.1 hypothetical protein [Alphaproteobacteria bacterium]
MRNTENKQFNLDNTYHIAKVCWNCAHSYEFDWSRNRKFFVCVHPERKTPDAEKIRLIIGNRPPSDFDFVIHHFGCCEKHTR